MKGKTKTVFCWVKFFLAFYNFTRAINFFLVVVTLCIRKSIHKRTFWNTKFFITNFLHSRKWTYFFKNSIVPAKGRPKSLHDIVILDIVCFVFLDIYFFILDRWSFLYLHSCMPFILKWKVVRVVSSKILVHPSVLMKFPCQIICKNRNQRFISTNHKRIFVGNSWERLISWSAP